MMKRNSNSAGQPYKKIKLAYEKRALSIHFLMTKRTNLKKATVLKADEFSIYIAIFLATVQSFSTNILHFLLTLDQLYECSQEGFEWHHWETQAPCQCRCWRPRPPCWSTLRSSSQEELLVVTQTCRHYEE